MTTRKFNLKNYFDDIDRLAENLENNFPGEVQDLKSLNETLTKYFDDRGVTKAKFIRSTEAKQQLIKNIRFFQGGGKDYKQDRQQTAKTVYPDTEKGREKYDRRGAGKSDLKGADTKHRKPPQLSKTRVRPESLTFIGRVRTSVVKARKETVIINKKKVIKFRDRRGRFVRVIDKKRG